MLVSHWWVIDVFVILGLFFFVVILGFYICVGFCHVLPKQEIVWLNRLSIWKPWQSIVLLSCFEYFQFQDEDPGSAQLKKVSRSSTHGQLIKLCFDRVSIDWISRILIPFRIFLSRLIKRFFKPCWKAI